MKNIKKYFLENGYKEFTTHEKNTVRAFQKEFVDDNGNVKYFINIKEFKFDSEIIKNIPDGVKENYRFEYFVQFNSKNGGTMNINMFSTGWDLDKVEKHVSVIYDTGLFHSYEYCN